MNKFYYFEGRIFEKIEEVEKATKNYNNKKYDEIITSKSFNEFEKEFDLCKEQGNSDYDSIEWSK